MVLSGVVSSSAAKWMVRPAKVKVEGEAALRARLGRRRGKPGPKPCHAPEQTVETRQQDGKIKGLGKIIVGPRAESVEHILRTAAGGEHEDGNEILLRSQFRGDREPIPPREHDVQDDGIDGVGGNHLQGGFAIHRQLRGVALGAQIEQQALRQVSLVFHHQNVGCSL